MNVQHRDRQTRTVLTPAQERALLAAAESAIIRNISTATARVLVRHGLMMFSPAELGKPFGAAGYVITALGRRRAEDLQSKTAHSDKVAHVRAAIASGKTNGHTCHWPGCERKVPPAAWGCKSHWMSLPAEFRRKIWSAYQPGQEATKTPSPQYLEVVREIETWIRERGNTL